MEIVADVMKMRIAHDEMAAQLSAARAEAAMWKAQAESLQRQLENRSVTP